jgi:Zn-dependent metalloprotease
MQTVYLKLFFNKVVLLSLLSFALIKNTNAQEKLPYDSAKTKKEVEAYKSLRKSDSLKSVKQFKKPDYTIQQNENFKIINFSENATTTVKNFFTILSEVLKLTSDNKFIFNNSRADKQGYTHYCYDQYYKGIPVMAGQYVLHEKNGRLDYATGNFFTNLSIDVKPFISKDKAIQAAIKFIGAEKYLWQNEKAQSALKKQKKDPNVSYYPKPELIIAPEDGNFQKENFRLCYKMLVQAEIPFKEEEVYVDAHTGEIVMSINQIQYADVLGTANTLYYGTRSITTDNYNGSYRLQESGSRPIQTYNMLNRTDITDAVDFTNQTNIWNNTLKTLRGIKIQKVNDNWKDTSDAHDTIEAPDIYIEIKDINNNLLFGKDNFFKENASFPLTFGTDSLPLLFGSEYTFKIYDKDALTSDLLGSFTFSPSSSTSGVISFSDNGTEGVFSIEDGNSGALDAHWCMEKIYDYYLYAHERKSYDDRNSPVKSYIHPNSKLAKSILPNNAFWERSTNSMFFGGGDNIKYSSFAALDIAGHEFTHGVILNNIRGGLLFNTLTEAAALNESFADIFGTAIEFSVPGIDHNWTMGEKVYIGGGYARSLKDPDLEGDPDTYLDKSWYTGTDVLTYVHSNAGVQNKWFYLLTSGGSDHIDKDPAKDTYKVEGIGIYNAASIAYHNMMDILTPTATYKQAYLGSLMAAEKYGFFNPSDGYRAVRAAWYAVGVAKKPEITSFTPKSGDEGTSVTITGKEFDGISFVGFNGIYVSPSEFTPISNTEINVLHVPQGATSGPISLIAGLDTIKSKDTFYICSQIDVTVNSRDATTFEVTAIGGKKPYTYSLDSSNFQTSNIFSGLKPRENYNVYVKDSVECEGYTEFYLDSIPCDTTVSSAGQIITYITVNVGKDTGQVNVDCYPFDVADQIDIYYDDSLVATTNGLTNRDTTLTFYFYPHTAGPYFYTIRVYSPGDQRWEIFARCPELDLREDIGKRVTGKSNIHKTAKPNKLRAVVSPNPANRIANLRISGIEGETSIDLLDLSGKLLYHTSCTKNGNIPLPVQTLSAGTYIITVTSGKERNVLKLVITK